MRTLKTSERLAYIQNLFAHESEAMITARQRAAQDDFPIHIGPEEGRLLQLWMRLINARKVLEIGTHAGYSTLWLAQALPQDGHLWTIEKSAKRYAMAQETLQMSPDASKITALEGAALDILPSLEKEGPFDFIFIDADKISYNAYLEWAIEQTRIGGLIVVDNTFLFEAVYQEERPSGISATAKAAVCAVNEKMARDPRLFGIMLATKEGMTIAMRQDRPVRPLDENSNARDEGGSGCARKHDL